MYYEDYAREEFEAACNRKRAARVFSASANEFTGEAKVPSSCLMTFMDIVGQGNYYHVSTRDVWMVKVGTIGRDAYEALVGMGVVFK